MTNPVENPHSRWYHCLCCYPNSDVRKNRTIEKSPAGLWENGKFHNGALPATEEFKKEFQPK